MSSNTCKTCKHFLKIPTVRRVACTLNPGWLRLEADTHFCGQHQKRSAGKAKAVRKPSPKPAPDSAAAVPPVVTEAVS